MTIETIADQCRELAALITRHTICFADGLHPTEIDRLDFARESSVATLLHSVVEPMLVIVVQGKKAALLGEETYHYGAAQYLVVSVDLPISGFIVEASEAQPYLGFKLNLDPLQLCDIIAAAPNMRVNNKDTSVRGFFVSTAEVSLVDCALRLTRLLDTPRDIPILAPIINHS